MLLPPPPPATAAGARSGGEGGGADDDAGATTQVLEYLCWTCHVSLAAPPPLSPADDPEDTEALPGEDTDTVLVLAFPANAAAAARPQQAFAYLPICATGLPFAVHADFELTSSRQQVRKDHPRNQLLRDAIAPAVAAAVRADRRLCEGFGGLSQVLPRVGAVADSFWRPVASAVRQLLRGEACLRSEAGRWRRPADLLLRPPDLPPSVLSNAALLEATTGQGQHPLTHAGDGMAGEQGRSGASCATQSEDQPPKLRGLEFVHPQDLLALETTHGAGPEPPFSHPSSRGEQRGQHGAVNAALLLGCRRFGVDTLIDVLRRSDSLRASLAARPTEWYHSIYRPVPLGP